MEVELWAALRTFRALQGGERFQGCLEAAGKSASSCRPERSNHSNSLRGRAPTTQPTAVPSHLETEHFGREVGKKKDLISVTLFFQRGGVDCDRRRACRWTWGTFHEWFHVFMCVFLSQDLAVLPKA